MKRHTFRLDRNLSQLQLVPNYLFQIDGWNSPILSRMLKSAIIFHCFLIIVYFSGENNGTCNTPQYLEVGTSGLVECSFERGLYAVAWYTTESFAEQTPLIRFVDGVKISEKFQGEFDMREDGSLVINHVTLLHDTNFTVLVFPSKGDDPFSMSIEVFVIVKPSVSFPIIENCQLERICYAQFENGKDILCYIANSRPALNLRWNERTSAGDLNLPSKSSVIATNGSLFTSQGVTKVIFEPSVFLNLLICFKREGIPGVILEDESAILIENSESSLLTNEPTPIYVERHTSMKLTCSNEEIILIVWKKANVRGESTTTLSYGAIFEKGFRKNIFNNYILEYDGSLLVHEVETYHEGLYGCVYQNEVSGGSALNNVIVYVSVQPDIQGCIHHLSCALEVEQVGSLTCSVKGIRPKVNLKWKTFSARDYSLITFFDHESTSTSNGDVFDVTLTSKYQLKDLSMATITIACVTSQFSHDILETSAKVDLLFNSVQSTDEANLHFNKQFLWTLMIVIPLCLLVIVVWTLFVVRGRRKTKQKMRSRFQQDEGTPMISSVTTQVESDSDPKSIFVNELKTKYKYQYDAVQPIPYIRDRLYCVDRVFVEGGFEKLISKDTIEGLGNWEKLVSYHDVTNLSSSSSSTRTIIEGEPGYGKSTLTLQLAYDWCNRNPTSPLADIDILILLRLRQLGGVHSIFRAIKQFILPRDSRIDEADIQNILQQSKSTLFILDGFDEYPEQEREDLNDIISTIRGEMFQGNFVVLTSRSFFLPKFYPPKTHRIRLTGFDSKARDAYIRKAVVGENIKAAEKIKRSLQKNSVLQGLCQVPLFFVMFAHMTHESDKFLKFKSVTSFFQYMIACFHSHMRNKMEDKNVRKINLHETDHDRLDEVAFEGLSGKNQKIVWRKKDLIQRLGKEFYNQYRATGILIEEEVLDISDRPVDTYYETEVRFYHKLFCEWYAAHYLCRKVLEEKVDLSELLQHMNPFDLQYTYRFACGINANAGDKIIEYLRGINDGDKFAVLCILEQTGKFDQIKNIVEDMCSNFITINNTDNMLLQGSIVQLLEIGSNNKIPVSFLWLKDCFNSIDLSTGQILLKSELSIPVLPTLIELAIGDNRREVTNEEFAATVEYSSMCSALRSLRFCHLLMPKVLDERCLSVVQGCNLQVLWITDGDEFLLNNKSGKWQKSDQRSSKNVFEGNSPAKENLFISLAKRKYDELIRAVQKMPSYLNKQVDEYQIYTEGTLEFLMSKGSNKSTDSWVPLQSYKDMFTDNKVKSKRRVLIGKRGFGKSTLALQMADDWSHGNSTSPLPKFDIFILVTLHPTEQIFESIYKHIKHNVIPKGSPLCCNDIKSLLLYTSSVLLVLDGFDFQPDCANDSKFDIFDILQGKILKNIDVISMCANEPSVCAPGTKFLRLMGFNEETQCEYIRKNVTGNDVVASDEVKQKLHDNPILADLSHIPMFLVFFAQLVHDNNVFQAIQTVTCFFHNLMKRFFSCMRNNDGDVDPQNCQLCEGNHTVIGKIAFEGLCNKNYDGIWRKEEICKKVGKDFYEHFLRTGILVEESSESQMFAGNLSVDKNDRQVRFYHRLFMDWFAAHHIAMCAEDFSEEKLNEYLRSVSPLEEQFMYLFACGLGQAAADNIIRCIKQNNKESNIEILCKIEQGGGLEAISQDLTNLCSRTVIFDQNKSKLLTRNTIQLVRIASIHNISISCVYLNESYSTVDLRGGNHLQLKSNLSIPVLTTLNVLVINTGDEGREITSEEFTGILQYSSKCLALKELWFYYCLLPPSVQAESVSVLRSRNVKVYWSAPVKDYQLNLQSGQWERTTKYGGGLMTDEDYQKEVKRLRKWWGK